MSSQSDVNATPLLSSKPATISTTAHTSKKPPCKGNDRSSADSSDKGITLNNQLKKSTVAGGGGGNGATGSADLEDVEDIPLSVLEEMKKK